MDIRDVKDFMVNLNEEAELKHQLDELTKAKLQDYLVGAAMDKSSLSYDLGRHQGEYYGKRRSGDKAAHYDLKYMDALNKKEGNRSKGIQIAASKLAGNGPNRYLRTKVPATEDVDRLNEGWIDHDETHMTNSAGTHHQFKTLLNYKSKNNYDVYVQHWKNPQKMNKEDRGSTHYIGSSDGDITKFDKLLGQAKRHKIRIYNRVVPSVGKEGKAHYDHSKYYSNLKEDVDQLGSSVIEHFESKDIISLTES